MNFRSLLGAYLTTHPHEPPENICDPFWIGSLPDLELMDLLKELEECQPAESIIFTLNDFDVYLAQHFDLNVYNEALFGDDGSIEYAAEKIAALFIEQNREHDFALTDPSQFADYHHYKSWVHKQSVEFVARWRQNVESKYGLAPVSNAPSLT